MGATAAIMLNQSLLILDSGAITSAVLGSTGLLAVIIAGWTTANPNIYRASLAYESVFKNVSTKKLTYIVGVVMTVVACFPITMNIMTIVNIIVLVVPPVGAIVFAEHWMLPKLGGTRYWAMYKGWRINYAGLAAWVIALVFVAAMTVTKAIHSYFLFLPTYLLAMVSYLILACLMGAKEDYSRQVEEERRIQEALEKLQDEEDEEAEAVRPRYPAVQKAAAYVSYGVLAVFAVFTFMVAAGSVTPDTWKSVSIIISFLYFALSGVSTYFKFVLVEKM